MLKSATRSKPPRLNYKKGSTTELLNIFAKAAAEQGEALRAADPKKANRRVAGP